MRAADTNLLVRLFAHDNPGQVAAVEAFISGGAWVSHLALVECIWVLASGFSKGHHELAAAVEILLNHTELVVQEPKTVQAALALFRKRPKLGFSDCMLVELARSAGHTPLGTFDRALGRAPGAEFLG